VDYGVGSRGVASRNRIELFMRGAELFVDIGCEARDLGVLEHEHGNSGMLKPWEVWGRKILTFGFEMECEVRPALV
jgi:hypothetical protein